MCFQSIFAQFYIVQDSDEYVNVRGEHNKIIDTIPTETIVWEAMPDFEWAYAPNTIYAGYTKGDKLYFGNIHKSRLKDVSTFTEVHKREDIKNLLPKSSYNKLMNFSTSSLDWKVYYDDTTQSYYIIHGGGDGAESYIVMWVVKNGEYAGRHICAGIPDQYLPYSSQEGVLLENAYRYVEENNSKK